LGRIGLPAWTTREAPASNRRGFYSHGEYRHCAAEGSAADTGREGSAADTGRRECTRATPNVQQWLVASQIRCALGNLARASLSVMQAGEPLAGDSDHDCDGNDRDNAYCRCQSYFDLYFAHYADGGG
jgi:hypothetical protein